MIRHLSRLAMALLGLYACAIGALFLGQRNLEYPTSQQRATAAEANLVGFQDLVLTTPDGETLVAWWKPPQPGKAVIIYFHGNGGTLWSRRLRAHALTKTGRGLLMVSYRGYSGSTGSPTETGLHTDALTAYNWVTQSYEASRLVTYGESLGTGVAVRLATERSIAGLILDAPYTSTADVASKVYWYVPVGLLMLDQFRSLDIIQRVKAPILIMHGTRDPVVPFEFGEKLFRAAPEPKTFLRLEGVGHSSNLERGGLKAVDDFVGAIETRAELELPIHP
ncbi:alpha/beta hydrolase [Microvirga alba]|uniref:Alpha/beta hydrolase n=1 Tax=Microvirga alba TaxID=2791025 RepID=A0A931FUC0_9HYPH|nr:alpha/beta hydrolase [Microvirga alba]MBF9235461.1 alpha/beta hydrolase [Microvirga alba]